MAMNGMLRLGPHEARVRLVLRRGVEHLGAEVTRPAAGHGVGRDEPGEAQRAKVHPRAGRRAHRAVVPGEVPPEVLAVELVAAVHGDGLGALVLAHAARAGLLREVAHPVHRDRRREDEAHGLPPALRLVVRHAQQVQRALDVDLVRQLGVALAPRREQRREVKHRADLVVRRDLVEEVAVEDVPRVRGLAQARTRSGTAVRSRTTMR
jgi:hypothetical protein